MHVTLILLALLLVPGCEALLTTDGGDAPEDLAAQPPPSDLALADLRGARPDLAAQAMACDIVRQDCGGGQKCTITDDGVNFHRSCLPPTGTVAVGKPCTREMAGLGHDDCVVGALCSAIGALTSDLSVHICRALCHANGDCQPGEACVGVGDAPDGVCALACAAFGSDCPMGFNCAVSLAASDHQNAVLTCRSVGTTKVGEVCRASTDCVADALCDALCQPLCDRAHPCAAGICNPIPGLPNGGGDCL